jgi:hypothetical protein
VSTSFYKMTCYSALNYALDSSFAIVSTAGSASGALKTEKRGRLSHAKNSSNISFEDGRCL